MGGFKHICRMKRRIYCTVTNDLNYDQRMIRICTSLAGAGYDVTLVGRESRGLRGTRGSGETWALGSGSRGSLPLVERPYRQHRLKMWSGRGKLFYLEYHIRLFFYLLTQKMDGICAIDLDSILPCYFISRLRRIPRVYDAHELFCEMKEVVTRPLIYKAWKAVERFAVPAFPHGYTVNELIAAEFGRLYGVEYAVIRNLPVLEGELAARDNEGTRGNEGGRMRGDEGGGQQVHLSGGQQGHVSGGQPERFILYQGAVNEGRCFETLIPAMAQVDAKLVICGEGNYLERARELVQRYGLAEKIVFKGSVLPGELKAITRSAWCGVTLFDRRGLSNYYSLANRFFDYMEAGIPQLAMNYPAYRQINNCYPIAVLLDEPGVREIADGLNELLNNTELYDRLSEGCKAARLRYNWQEEEKILIRYYHQLFN
jgi:glycosyltransferase involved in cell wall biosynthesis